ncbi:MAG: XRE family transcriptional regulator [Chloroflexota bacterium]|nr:XRE family transcriptional regulator [Chloroflexota bacterium]
MINSERVKQAREMRGLTQTELATRVGTTQAAIASIEGNRFQPSDELIEAIAIQTGFPPSFFRQDEMSDFPLGSLLFRARAAMSARERAMVHRYGEVMFELAERMAARVRGIPLRLPRLAEDPVTAAQATRSSMGLAPNVPINNLIRSVEKCGVLVLMLPNPMEKGDAFSLWAGKNRQRPVIVVSGHAPSDRLRFSVAHELGHLVMHEAPSGKILDLEQEAHQFAAELLMPEAAMREEITPPVTLTSMAELKPRWKVAIQALIRRSKDLGILSDRQYRYLFEQVASRGWRTREPINLDVAMERPRAVRQMAELLYGQPINYERLAADVHLSVPLVQQIIEVHEAQKEQPQLRDDSTQDDKVLKFVNKR